MHKNPLNETNQVIGISNPNTFKFTSSSVIRVIVVCVWKYADQKTVENTKITTAAYKRPLSYLDPFKSSLLFFTYAIYVFSLIWFINNKLIMNIDSIDFDTK